ncbi:MAG: hypothetical protein EP306_07925 [Burkholderiales bacterium]|nr:MAG: hypothetical protein EP306_07925 [Burkholderiales bacterium]
MMAPDFPSPALRPLLCLGVAALAVVAAPSWANPAGEGEKPAIAATPAVLPYGAGYEQRMRAAQKTHAQKTREGSAASPPSTAEPGVQEAGRNGGFGRSRSSQGGGQGSGGRSR